MCWLPLVVGAAMSVAGIVLLTRYFLGTGENRPEVAGIGRTESMLIGALLVSVGPLLLVLGITGTICNRLGIGW